MAKPTGLSDALSTLTAPDAQIEKKSFTKKTVLVVEDNEINRLVLCNILKSNYQTLTAENGQIAMDMLRKAGESISLILLDIVMPVMDGYSFLEALKASDTLSAIPVIVTTSSSGSSEEIRCLSSGASDFVSKPYNPEIVLHRVASIIRLRESSAMLNALEFDHLTGLYSKDFFYRRIAMAMEREPEQSFDILCGNIENFKLVNERYGIEVGNKLLKFIADRFKQLIPPNDILARIGADVFAVFCKSGNNYDEKLFAAVVEREQKESPVPNITIKFGLYQNIDHSIPPSGLCDRTQIALNRIKRKYGRIIAQYDDSLRLAMLREQQILDDMDTALAEKQFIVYYQPKHDAKTNVISGAEALVRWQHPKYGFLSPGEFIPLFERNGFITKVDLYVYKNVLEVLHGWLKSERSICPISLNASRVDFDAPSFVMTLCSMADDYQVPHEMIHFEVTESAYTEDPVHIIESINELRSMGFKVEMDDFGSGYSSLNMLSELSVDVLKLDAGFIRKMHAQNNHSIVSFIISLSKWLNLTTVAEGVETQEQLDFLRELGCDLIQGYIYAKPMPLEEFELYSQETGKQASPLYADAQASFSSSGASDKPTILIVEDASVNRRLLSRILGKEYRLIETENGDEAFHCLMARSAEISLVLLDLLMPVMDGYRFLSLVRKNHAFKQIPIIITSAADADGELQALSLGADGFVAKPYQEKLLRYHVKKAVDTFELQKANEALKRQRDMLSTQAYHDALTGLYNRRGLDLSVEQLPCGAKHAVFIIDVDDLKACNDTFGHSGGDELIRRVAQSLLNDTREDDIIARIGGDEFVVVMKGLSDPKKALIKGNHICDNIASLTLFDHCRPSVSAGAAILYDPHAFYHVFKRADQALYTAKRTNKGHCCLSEDNEK